MTRLAALLLLVTSVACAPKDPTYSFKYAEKRARLDNGLRLVVIPDRTTPLVHVDVRYEVGSNEDPPGKAGLAHLVEHMMFQHRMLGADKPATFDLLPQIALGYNAGTTHDLTHYYLFGPREEVESLLKIEAFRMNARCQTIPPAQFDREREVVRNEIRGARGRPDGLIPGLVSKAVYPPGHPYSHDAGGDDRQLASITFQDVCDFLERYYTPDRATVIVTGNVDPTDVGKKFAYLFGAIAKRKPAPRAAVAPIALQYKRVEHELDIERPQIWVLWKLPPVSSPAFANADALLFFAGRLAGLAEEWEFASDVRVGRWGGNLAPVFSLTLELYPGGDVDQALDYVWRATGTAHWGLKHIDFDREARNRLKMGFVERIEPLAARAFLVANGIQFPSGDVDFNASGQEYLISEFEKIDKLSGAGYRDFVKTTLDRDKAVVVVFKPKAGGEKGDVRARLEYSAGGHDRQPEPLVDAAEAMRPLPAPKSSSVLAGAQRYTLDNGMRVILLAYDGLPIVQAELVLNAGSAVEPASRAGLADLTASFLRPPRDSNYAFWVSLGREVDDDHTTFISRGLNIYTDVVIEALERTVKIGEYDQESLERHHKRVRRQHESADHRLGLEYQRVLNAALFGEQHPYTVKGTTTPATIGNLGYDAVTAFRRDHYSARNATLVVVGNFDAARARQKIEETFGAWAGGRQDPPVAAARPQRAGPVHVGVVGKGTQQTQITIAYPAPAGRDGQHAARLVLAEMLNEQMAAIRTELGATYGAGALRTDNLGPNAYMMGSAVDSARAGESLVEMRRRVDAMRRGDDFDVNFALARRQVLRELLTESTNTSVMASRLARIAVFGLGPDYYDDLVRRVAAVPPAQVKALVAEELKPDLEVVVCVADRASLEAAFRGAALGTVAYVQPK
ncbi:MAG TPA: pitrilysin family protein [Kofleriaceae bacterium]|nr:pitrilysin family protein [Kofleriaceae bacterium]